MIHDHPTFEQWLAMKKAEIGLIYVTSNAFARDAADAMRVASERMKEAIEKARRP